ncbi:hypothetical protein K469DRAFT_6626 [Zopfia rhizophila CBS 207.26]|uniref:Inositol-1-monophosphatase n=1 Tax=Zopfia rhizophila CBS 207.26 TaxID=1314779 RepID=A0A6A6EVM4_9PEZI|nr:hypothetical protein K469DRAFT_6626 [Zopfia rhizophila CBS 207.26]
MQTTLSIAQMQRHLIDMSDSSDSSGVSIGSTPSMGPSITTLDSLNICVTTPDSMGPCTTTPEEFELVLRRHSLTLSDLFSIHDFLIFIARKAGEMMYSADPCVSTSSAKRNTSDLVTATDKAIEEMITLQLQAKYPQIHFLGEESFSSQKLTDRPTFICDPIDGTLNFIHGFPNIAVSLALTIEKKPVVGVVYNPFRGDLYTAIKGQGAYLTTSNGHIRRLPLRSKPAPLTSLNGCLVAMEWGSERQGPNWDLRTSMSKALMSSKASGGAMSHSIRSSGSAALDFCYVAAGQIDVFWEGGCWIWDVCAGWIILEEAGGLVASANPGDWEPQLEGRLYLAVRVAEKEGQQRVVEELWALMENKKFVFI